ncbi:hypothetical protein B0J14DRAFT_667578, partial [Halenospora varia]
LNPIFRFVRKWFFPIFFLRSLPGENALTSASRLVPLQISAYMAGAQLSGFFTSGGYPTNFDGSKGCTSGTRTTTISCPTTVPNPSDQQGAIHAIDYTCTNTEGCYADILRKYGIEKSWIAFGKFLAHINSGYWQNTDPFCAQNTNTYWTGFPILGVINVTDPKSLISVDKVKFLSTQLSAKAYWMNDSLADLQNSDIVDAASIPALLTVAAVDSMSKIVDIANQVSAEFRKGAILAFVMSILLLIPGLGQAAGAAGMAALRTIIILLGDSGNIALAIYTTVKDPKSAVFLMFGLLMGGGGSAKSIKGTAAKRRAFTSKDTDTLAPIKSELQKITTARSSCFK